MTTKPPTYADLGVVEHDGVTDVLVYWRMHLYDGKRAEPVELLFDEEPEHRAVEELMTRTDSISVAIYPPSAEAPADVDEAADRLLAVARGLKSHNDPAGLATLVAAAADYQSLHRADIGATASGVK